MLALWLHVANLILTLSTLLPPTSLAAAARVHGGHQTCPAGQHHHYQQQQQQQEQKPATCSNNQNNRPRFFDGASAPPRGDRYLVGVGKADITGPIVEITLAGYGKFEQGGTGLRQRLYSRAFIVADVEDPRDRVVYLVLDDLAGDTAVRYGLFEALARLGGEYAAYYNHNNVALTATHSHAGPGAWFNYFLLQTPTLGFDRQSYQAIVDGAALSIKRAHDSLQEGYLDVGTTEIRNASINRSLHAYLQNPEDERAQYPASVDTTMTVLRLQRSSDDRAIGIFTWFAVHGTSLYNNNTHVAGDNKGVAAWMFERAMDADDSAADGFVAGFSQANAGDVSPNTLGAWCDDGSGVMCSLDTSACPSGRTDVCKGRGPEFRALDNGVKSCFEIGRRQFAGAKEVYDAMEYSTIPVRGSIKAFHFFQDMTYWKFNLPDDTEATTCPAGLGYSTAAGTTDGDGLHGFTQGITTAPSMGPRAFLSHPLRSLWSALFKLLKRPSAEQRRCHGAKPVLLDAGGVTFPYAWEPNLVDMQMLRIGQVFIAVSPSEITTMAGRRWKAAIADEARRLLLLDAGTEPVPLVVGPANTYAHYVTTPEEYAAQRYEGSSTMFGPNQLQAFINLTTGNMHHLASEAPDPLVLAAASSRRPKPPNHVNSSISLFPGVFFDRAPASRPFGHVLHQPRAAYKRGEVVRATFQGANPRNNLRLEDTYLALEREVFPGRWVRVLDDSDWFLLYSWRRTSLVLGYSEVDVAWETTIVGATEGDTDLEPGTYRFKYYGDAQRLFGGVNAFEGTTNSFTLQ
ncbi:Ceramidase [Purpureocillium takamizusanense]|uniref:Neutral ceramidase n=1 Tax=Purpureocillium takamizusanense TaxID=2060973 RepID=A0A9Q8QBW5_9HYPO|nr:Ceramidase [Purpureocillium takamizusanense]UNI16422.1 Ceramidase [Purpureocillium takamizusanense]